MNRSLIDFDHYRARAREERALAIAAFGRGVVAILFKFWMRLIDAMIALTRRPMGGADAAR